MNHLIKRTYLFTGICCLLLCLLPIGLSQDATESSTQETSVEKEATSTTEENSGETTEENTESSVETSTETGTTETDEVIEETMTEEVAEESEESTEESEPVVEEATEESASVESTNEETTNVEAEETPMTESETSGDESTEEDTTVQNTLQNDEEFGIESTEEIPNPEAVEEPDAETAVSEEESAEGSEASADEVTDNEFTTEEEADTSEETGTTETSDAGNEQANQRVITIDYSGGNRKAVDFRYGPWIYTHPDEEGVVGAVGTEENSQLTIYAKEAELKAPEDVLIATAGERVANFTGGVRVSRKRLTAIGEGLEYSEETGFGELSAEDRIDITVLPKENDGDITTITAAAATFDVDTDVSVSRGEVTLESGTQSAEAEEITFEEGLDLAVMTSPDGQVVIKRGSDDGELIITADIVRVLTDNKKLMASGNVTLVDGSITTTGEVVFFDDAIERAEVFGTPENLAVSIDSEFDVTIKGQRLDQRIDLDLVQILDDTAEIIWDEADFLLTSETSTE